MKVVGLDNAHFASGVEAPGVPDSTAHRGLMIARSAETAITCCRAPAHDAVHLTCGFGSGGLSPSSDKVSLP